MIGERTDIAARRATTYILKQTSLPYEKIDRGSVKHYRVTGGHCRSCPIKSSCLPDCQKFRARFVYRGVHQDEVEAVRRRQHAVAFRK